MWAELWESLRWNAYSPPVAAVSTIILSIGIFVFWQNLRGLANFAFFLICLAVNLWLYGFTLLYSTSDPDLAIQIYRRLTFLGVAFISTSVYFFSVVWLKLIRPQSLYVLAGFLGSAFFYYVGVTGETMFPFVYDYFWGFYPRYGPEGLAFLVFFFGYFLAAFSNFVTSYRKESSAIRRKQIQWIAVAFLISFTGSIDYLPKLGYYPVYPLGYVCVLTWIVMVAYSIIKHKVMDIETVIHKTLMWSILSSLVFVPLGLVFYRFRDWFLNAHPLVVSVFGVALFTLFLGYAKTIQPWIDHIFQRRKQDLERALIEFNVNLVHLKGLEELVAYLVRIIREILYVEKVQVFLRHGRQEMLVRVDREEAGTNELSLRDPFVHWLESEDDVVQSAFVDLDPRFEKVREEAKPFFEKLQAEVAVPLVLNGDMIGLIPMGQKANLKSFTGHEIKFLAGLRTAVAIAFSNSLRLIEMQESLKRWNEELEGKVHQRTQELEEAQKQLIQAEKLATLGTLAGGVAHEINNPLTAVLTNAQLLKLTLSDAEDAESVALIEEGAKRCQIIVQKLMKYARKPVQEEILQEVDINHIVENVLSFLQYQLDQENIHLVKSLSSVHKVKGASNELEQVFINIVLNARDAIKSAKETGTVQVETYESNGEVCIRIEDDGVGIPEENLPKIFDPFFTTKDVGKGTGLGLSIAYGIVDKHGGRIQVESKVGTGSRFTVHLRGLTAPRAEQSTAPLLETSDGQNAGER